MAWGTAATYEAGELAGQAKTAGSASTRTPPWSPMRRRVEEGSDRRGPPVSERESGKGKGAALLGRLGRGRAAGLS